MTYLSYAFFCATIAPKEEIMPKETFDNLSAEKKRRIFYAAVAEFAAQRFSEASINKIVKAAGISRGSFYQYFEGKEDVYLYTLNEIGKEKLEVLLKVGAPDQEADFFQIYEHMFRMAFIWARERPDYSRIGSLMRLDDSDFILKLKGLADEGLAKLASLIERDKARGIIKPDVDSKLVIDLLYNALTAAEMQASYLKGSEEAMLEKLRKVISIVKGGIALV